MAWAHNWEKSGDVKFLTDLERHTYISDKAHQEIIDQAGLNPAGYDNYLKGWVKHDGTIKLWVETVEDVVFRYWDQIKLAFSHLLKEKLTAPRARTYAIVNRIERFSGLVQDFTAGKSKNQFFEKQLGYAVHFYGKAGVEKGRDVLLLVNYKLPRNRYVLAGTRGRVLTASGGGAKSLRVRWRSSCNGYLKPAGALSMLTDRRLLTLV